MTLEIQPVTTRKELEFPMLKEMTDEATKEYHLKRLEGLCKDSIKKGTFYNDPDYKFSPTMTMQERRDYHMWTHPEDPRWVEV